MTSATHLAARAAAVGAAVGFLAQRRLLRQPPGGARSWTRSNYRGSSVSLTGGPAVAAGVAVGAVVASTGIPSRGARTAAVGAIVAAAGAGLYDDLSGTTTTKGFRGHLTALRSGQVTSGAAKIVVISTAGLGVGLTAGSTPMDAVVIGGVVAGSANLVNLLDLRPGRALKVATIVALPLLATDGAPAAGAVLGTALVAAPTDLAERTMLGDCGANAIGAALGLSLVAALGPRGRMGALGALVALMAASEKVSFTRVIERTPGLRELDRLGRVG